MGTFSLTPFLKTYLLLPWSSPSLYILVYCGLSLPIHFSSIPSCLLSLCTDFLFPLSSNPLQTHQSTFPVVYFLILFLPFWQSLFLASFPYPFFQYVHTILISAIIHLLCLPLFNITSLSLFVLLGQLSSFIPNFTQIGKEIWKEWIEIQVAP